MNTDTLTTLLGVGVGVLHQVGIVGTLPATKSDWINTGTSVLIGLLGYFSQGIKR